MYSHLITKVVAAIKPAESYQFYTYKGKPMQIPYRGIEVPLTKGQKFGVRKSANGKKIRLVMGDEVSRVFTIDLELAKKLAKNIKEATQ